MILSTATVVLNLCALSPAPMAMAGNHAINPFASIHGVQMVINEEYNEKLRDRFLGGLLMSSKFLHHTERRTHNTPGRVLIVDGKFPEMVNKMRHYGFNAFGLNVGNLLPYDYTVVGDPNHAPFKPITFYIAYWLSDQSHYSWDWRLILREITNLVEHSGFFVFEPGMVPYQWGRILNEWGWTKLPFSINSMEIYQRPNFKNVLSFTNGVERWTLKLKGGVQIPVGTGGSLEYGKLRLRNHEQKRTGGALQSVLLQSA